MSDLVKILPGENKYLSVTWQVNNWCNYKCSYCGPSSNGGYFKWPSLEECKLIISQIKKQSNHKYRFYTFYFKKTNKIIVKPRNK